MPTPRACRVSFTDTEGIAHAVEVAASTLYEAATFAMAEFRRCGFTENAPCPATRLTVTVKAPATSHDRVCNDLPPQITTYKEKGSNLRTRVPDQQSDLHRR